MAAVSQELIRAKAALVAKHRSPFLAEARRHGATDVVPLDLAPMVYLRVPAAKVDTLAAEPSVRQVRAPAGWAPTMNTAHNAVGANWTDSKGYTGGGVVVGIVEYTRVDYSRPGLSGTRLDSYRVSSTGLSCPHSRGEYNNSSAISHVSWAAAIAVGRGTTYKGIANAARLVDVSADFSPTSDRADPRILKAVDCAILQGGAHLITMSLVQNDSSRYSTSNAYFDAVVWDHHRLIVGNGGNNYSESNSHCPGSTERVRSPGSAWNVLSVGGTSNDAGRLWYRASGSEPSYCWEDPPGHSGDVHDRVKPEIVAPAQNVSTYFYNGSGVSASSPMVAGVAAALLDQRPSLLNYPEQVKAILLAGSEAKHALTPEREPEHLGRGPRDRLGEVVKPGRRKGHGDRHRELRRDDVHGRPPRRLHDRAGPPVDELRGAVHLAQGPLRDRLAGPYRARQPTVGVDVLAAIRRLQPHDPQGLDARRQFDPQRLERGVGRLHRRCPRSRHLHGGRDTGPLGMLRHDRAAGLGVGELQHAVGPARAGRPGHRPRRRVRRRLRAGGAERADRVGGITVGSASVRRGEPVRGRHRHRGSPAAIEPGVGRLVWLVDRAGRFGVWTTDLAGGDVRAYLADLTRRAPPSWTPARSGTTSRCIRELPGRGGAQLWVLSRTRPPRSVMSDVTSFVPRGDTEILAVVDLRTTRSIWRVPLDGTAADLDRAAARSRTTGPHVGPFGFAISPDGRTVAAGWVGGPLEVFGPVPSSARDLGAPLVVADDGRVIATTGRAGEAYLVDGDRLVELAPADSDPLAVPGTGSVAWATIDEDGGLVAVEVRDLLAGTSETYPADGLATNVTELDANHVILEATPFDPLTRTVTVVDRRDGGSATFEASAPAVD